MVESISIKRANREIIEAKLLVALQDEDKVAVLCACDDLRMLIEALAGVRHMGQEFDERRRMLRDLKALWDAAFAGQDHARRSVHGQANTGGD